jgi:hypothetical protein
VDYYELILFGHLIAVITWVGGDIMLQVLGALAQRRGPQAMVDFAGDTNWIGTRVLVPSSLAVIVFGFLLVDELGYGLGDAWISFALAVFLGSFLLGAGFLGPESGRIPALAAERGVEDSEVQRRIGRIVVLSRIELLFLVLVVLDMVVKPGA